jgi:hypothetical protein
MCCRCCSGAFAISAGRRWLHVKVIGMAGYALVATIHLAMQLPCLAEGLALSHPALYASASSASCNCEPPHVRWGQLVQAVTDDVLHCRAHRASLTADAADAEATAARERADCQFKEHLQHPLMAL